VKIKSPRWTTERFKLAARAGCFRDMKVELVNDGPVTIWLDTAQ